MSSTFVGASLEVLEHHATQHPCPPAEPRLAICPCGRSLALVCPTCDEPVFGVAAPGEACEHLLELLGQEVAR